MENRQHHYSCRCNDCVRQRNARRRRSADRHAEEGNPWPAGAMWYEVPRDHPIRYADDIAPSASSLQFEQTARRWLEDAIRGQQSDGPQFPSDDGGENDAQPPKRADQEFPHVEPPVRYQRDDMEPERERQLQEFRRQQEERQRDWEQRRDQLRAELAPDVQFISDGPDGGTPAPPSGGGSVPASAEPAPQAAPMPSATSKHQSRRGFFLPLLLTCVLLVVIVGAGALTYAALAASRDDPEPEALAPTPDLGSTIAAAVAAAWPTSPVTPLTPSPSDNPTSANVGPPPLPPARLPTVECPACVMPGSPVADYVEWVREPTVSNAGIMAFRVRINDQAKFVVAGADCGFENLTLHDDNGDFYGAIIPHGMDVACGAFPGDRIAETYRFVGDLLTVRLQIDPVAASHPGLTLCLWSGGTSQELLDCEPVKQP